MPAFSNLLNNISWFTESNAFMASKNTPTTYSPLFKESLIKLIKIEKSGGETSSICTLIMMNRKRSIIFADSYREILFLLIDFL